MMDHIPPVTRTLFLAVAVLSFFNSQLKSLPLLFPSFPLLPRAEIWASLTSFLFAGTGLHLIFHLIMLYQHSSSLERLHYPRNSPDYAWQLAFATLAVILVNQALGIPFQQSGPFNPLLFTVIYLNCHLSPNNLVDFLSIFQVPANYLIYALASMDFLAYGPQHALQSVTGFVVGHIWWMLVWKTGSQSQMQGGWAKAPRLMQKFIGGGPKQPPAPPKGGYGTLGTPRFRLTSTEPNGGKWACGGCG